MDNTSTPAEREALYAAATYRNSDYYVPKFMEYDADASRVSWNWPAFFVTVFWMIYRRMYAFAAIYYFVWPIALIVVALICFMVMPPAVATLITIVAAIAVPYVVIPMFANSLYHRHVRDRILQMRRSAPSHDVLVERLVGQQQSGSGVAILIVVIVLGGVFMVGILAAISIPAYQDYTIRSQTTEGLTLAQMPKAAVAEYYAEHGEWPADLAAVDIGEEITGRYVDTVSIDNGTIVIEYGEGAHVNVRGRKVTITPVVTETGDITWVCGYASSPVDGESPDSQYTTDVPEKYLPASCRAPR